MNCDEVMEAMQRDLDGDLTAEERRRMQIHLRHCPDCVPLYARLRRLSSKLENLPKVEPPCSLVDALLPRGAVLSPDGQWRAAVVAEGGAKRVVVHDAAGAARFRGHALSPDARVTLQWEGNALVYDVVTAQDGRETAERWRVNVAAGTEERLPERPHP